MTYEILDNYKFSSKMIDFKVLGEIYTSLENLEKKIHKLISKSELLITPHSYINSDEIRFLFEEKDSKLILKFIKKSNAKQSTLSVGLDLWEVTYCTEGEIINGKLFKLIQLVDFECQQFSYDELKRIIELNPLIKTFTKIYSERNTSLNDMFLVIREHLLLEKLNLIEALIALGLKPSNCWIITKEDKTTYYQKVFKTLQNKGVNVIEIEVRNQIKQHVHEISRYISLEHTVVLDDGGELIKAFYEISKSNCFVAIETTTKGIKLLEKSEYFLSVIDLANSSLKKNLSKEIAISCVVNLRNILKHEKMSKEYCHIIGFGKLGEEVAILLNAFGMNVTVYDKSEKIRSRAKGLGFIVFDSSEEAFKTIKHKYVFGCTGFPSLRVNHLSLLAEDSYLVALSSQDLKEVKKYLDKHAIKRKLECIGDRFIVNNSRITLVAEGHSVNLYYSEGVSEKEYDPFTTLMFLSILESRKNRIEDSSAISKVEKWCESIMSKMG